MKQRIWSKEGIAAGIIVLLTIIITVQCLLLDPKTFVPGGQEYTHYNNYLIFKQSFYHLIGHTDLYKLYPAEYWDLYKYSPTFALLMAPLAVLPDGAGLLLWNLLNALALFYALWRLPYPAEKKRWLAIGFVLIELVTSLQNSQSNALIAGLIILAFIYRQKNHIALATLFITLTVFIKIFGVVAFALFLFYPDKIKTALYTIGWTVLLALLPLMVVPASELAGQYESWARLLREDHTASMGMSVSGWLESWFGIVSKNPVVGVGALLFCLPMIRFRHFGDLAFRLLFLASILVWIVIFNHKAESPTFVIAISGAAIWYFCRKTDKTDLVLLLFALVFTVLSPTDLFPRSIRDGFVGPYSMKAVPCIFIWFKIIIDLMRYSGSDRPADHTPAAAEAG